jgi:hypothetical protein
MGNKMQGFFEEVREFFVMFIKSFLTTIIAKLSLKADSAVFTCDN